ncbi:MAG: hypothetical protein NZX77_22615 [Polyangiaceae bacterium]|nr:hypothetical protein [Polyangiaceae bacterium]
MYCPRRLAHFLATLIALCLSVPKTVQARTQPTRMNSPWLLGGGIATSCLGLLIFAIGVPIYRLRNQEVHCNLIGSPWAMR